MSKLTSGQLNVFFETEREVPGSYHDIVETAESSPFPIKRPSGFFKLNNDRISFISESLQKTLGQKENCALEALVADLAVLKMKLHQLNTVGKAEIRLIDAEGTIFWTRISSTDNGYLVEDIDIEKNFELDCEDLCEEQEREFNRCDSCMMLQ